jgi:ribosomal protein L11
MKKDDMNTDDKDAIIRSIAGTAKNMGITVEDK